MRLTREEFIEKVNLYERMCQEEDAILDVIGAGIEWKPSEWIGAYYTLLTEMCELPETMEYGTDLDYYCYSLNFGHDWEPGMITDENENDIPCRNAEELWDLINLD